jgi:hypothetical protein
MRCNGRFYCLKSSMIRDMTPYSLLKANQSFAGTACYLLHAAFLLDLFFHPKDWGDLLLRSVSSLSTDYVALCQEYGTLHNHRCENLKSCLCVNTPPLHGVSSFTCSDHSVEPTSSSNVLSSSFSGSACCVLQAPYWYPSKIRPYSANLKRAEGKQ